MTIKTMRCLNRETRLTVKAKRKFMITYNKYADQQSYTKYLELHGISALHGDMIDAMHTTQEEMFKHTMTEDYYV